MIKPGKYTTALAKGQGIIPETLILLKTWELGMSAQALKAKCISEGLLGKATAQRTHDIVIRAFAPRYLSGSPPKANYLKYLFESGVGLSTLSQLFLIYTARNNLVLHDFIIEIYWTKYAAGAGYLEKTDALHFLDSAYLAGKIVPEWSDSIRSRVARYLNGCLADFNLLEPFRKSRRKITPTPINEQTARYLAYELHFGGLSDNSLPDHSDWRLFGLEKMDVIHELRRSATDYFIPQYSGDLLRISWKYKTMEETLRAIAGSKL